ncbi:MCE family protein [Mycolicibacterium sp.]|uniref:MCE family protein n=1 Tax=Mycolicibacterium sp. TaxID=2320850 RepID=UPI003D1479D7
MRGHLARLLWRLAAFVAVCLVGTFALFAVFAQLRFQRDIGYLAVFSDVSGLAEGNFVRIAGVEVGKVETVAVQDDATVLVSFTTDDTVVLTAGTRAVIRYDDLIGGRFLELTDGPGDTRKLGPGATIPLTHTAPALDLDALIGGFRPLFRALEPEQVNALSGQLIAALQGQGPTVGSLLSQTAALTSTLADRDDLIGQVITNLNTVLGSLAGHSEQFGQAVDTLAELTHALADRDEDLRNGVAHADAAAGALADLLARARPSIPPALAETDRAATHVLADHDYFDDLLATLPESYRVLNRQALGGDFFSFYLCDLVLKLNGKGGQPVYVKVAGQSTGRCTPR